MSRTRSLVVALTLALVACKGGESDAGANKQAASAPAAEQAKQPQTPATPATPIEDTAKDDGAAANAGSESESGDEQDAPPPPLPATFETLGIAACDDYVTAHVACIEKLPEAEREAARREVFDNLEVWKQTAAGGPSAQKGLTVACRSAREQAKHRTQNLGCQW